MNTEEIYYTVEVERSPLGGHPTLAIKIGVTSASMDNPEERYLDDDEIERLAERLEDAMNDPDTERPLI